MSLFDLFEECKMSDVLESVTGEHLLEYQKEIIDASSKFIGRRNEFQKRVPASEIKRIEEKMLPSPNGRKREETCMSALTKEERLIYANFLESVKNQPLGASAFRNYKDVVKKEKKKERR